MFFYPFLHPLPQKRSNCLLFLMCWDQGSIIPRLCFYPTLPGPPLIFLCIPFEMFLLQSLHRTVSVFSVFYMSLQGRIASLSGFVCYFIDKWLSSGMYFQSLYYLSSFQMILTLYSPYLSLLSLKL